MRRTRETWVNTIFVLTCVLIAAVSVFQNAVKTEVIQNTVTYNWFSKTVGYFLVPLIFLCCGYLHQQGRPVKSVKYWKNNVLNKLVVIGIPFVVFSCISWLIKTDLSADTSSLVGSLLRTLFVRPATPYGYLYGLFFVFLVTPTINKKLWAFAFGGLAIGARGAGLLLGRSGVYAVDMLLNYWIWFVLGMFMDYFKTADALRKQKGVRRLGVAILVLFFAGSIGVVVRGVSLEILSFLFGVFGCSAALALAVTTKFTDESRKIIRWMSDYTLPVFLMHTIFAVPLTNVLLNAGVTNGGVHIGAGLAVSFAGPILVGFILKKLKWAEFVLYPGKFLKFGSKKEDVSHGKKA